ncbi:hypothetical protein Pth03_18490 [Planotetraspora thailandica]|uniref:Uncharacterized protein n=1 Tax=Planotetraspora thailandica TaxID=487172 RepID=A0A8J3VAX2_9ACTN|nr:hypothetical protein [Planotetraspora thailandica]GII53460.1 hypothetical protein Pth03_18490 [Planotetraspora thailandica]
MNIPPRPGGEWRFNPPPGWPAPPKDWIPAPTWSGPDPSWPAPPANWPWWVRDEVAIPGGGDTMAFDAPLVGPASANPAPVGLPPMGQAPMSPPPMGPPPGGAETMAFGGAPAGSAPMGAPPMGRAPMGPPPMGPPPGGAETMAFGGPPAGSAPMGAPPMGPPPMGPPPMGQAPMAPATYDQVPHDQPAYDQAAYDQAPYDPAFYNQAPYDPGQFNPAPAQAGRSGTGLKVPWKLVGIGAAVVVVGVAAFLAYGGPGNDAVGTTSAGSTASSAPEDAATQEQAAAIDKVLDASKPSRGKLQQGLSQMLHCSKPGQAVATLQRVTQQRASQVQQAKKLKVDALDGGDALKRHLVDALTASQQADAAYLKWAQKRQALHCKGKTAGDPFYDAGTTASLKATKSKTAFVKLWGPIAEQEGLPARTTGEI